MLFLSFTYSLTQSQYNCIVAVMQFYLIYKQLQNKRGHAAVDSDEEVDGGENNIGGAGNAEYKGCRVHQRGDGPPTTVD